MMKVRYIGCSDAQCRYGSDHDPRDYLAESGIYEVIKIEIHDWRTVYYIRVPMRGVFPFNSVCFEEIDEVEIAEGICYSGFEALIKLLKVYAEIDAPVSQHFYQGLCLQAKEHLERLQAENEGHDDLVMVCEEVVRDLECFCLDEPENMGRGPCVVCQAKAALDKVRSKK